MPMPRKPANKKAVKTSITLDPKVKSELETMLSPGESLSMLIRQAVQMMLDKCATNGSGKEFPYLLRKRIKVDRLYNPEYGDDRICECGHEYHRHFDSYEDMEDVGCKYCRCFEFKEQNKIE